MKKFILFSILSVLLYSAPGYAGGGEEARAAFLAAEEAAEKAAPEERRVRLRAAVEAALAAAPEEIVSQRATEVAKIEAALAEAEVAKSAAVARSRLEMRTGGIAMRTATGAPATEASAAPTASLERELEVCVGSLAQTVLAHAQGVKPVLQWREDALREHLQRLNASMGAISDRNLYHPFDLMMSMPERVEYAGLLRRMADITSHACSITKVSANRVSAYLDDQTRYKRSVSEIIQKASALQSAEATGQTLAQEALPVEATVAARQALEPLPVAAEEEHKVAALKVLCGKIEDSDNQLSRQELVALSEETSSEMGDFINKMDLELLAMWRKEIAYHEKILGVSTIMKDTTEKAYGAVHRCYGALCAQAVAEGSSTSETGPSIDPEDLLERCKALLSDIDTLNRRTDQKSSDSITCSQRKFGFLTYRPVGVSLVEAMLEPPLVEVAKGLETAASATLRAAPTADADETTGGAD